MRIIKFTAFAILVCMISTAFTGCAYFDGLFGKDDAGDATDDNCHENEQGDNETPEQSNPEDAVIPDEKDLDDNLTPESGPSESVAFWQAEIYGYVNDSISSEFAENNKIKVAYEYDDPERENAPDTLTFIVNDKETFDEIFADAPFDVDFENETVIVHSRMSTISHLTDYLIDDISVNGEHAEIIFGGNVEEDEIHGVYPSQRWFVIKMNKADFTNVTFHYRRQI